MVYNALEHVVSVNSSLVRIPHKRLTLAHLSAQRKRFWYDKGYLGAV